MSRTKADAAKNEDKDIQDIVTHINSNTTIGTSFKTDFAKQFGQEILEAKLRGKSRSNHFDFYIRVRSVGSSDTGEWKQVEHKGSQQFRTPSEHELPWHTGVQFYNGGCEHYTFAKMYARLWYDMYVSSGFLSTQYALTSPIPSFDTWFEKDCKQQQDPKTEYGLEFKQEYRKKHGNKSSALSLREKVNLAFVPSQEDTALFQTNVQTLVDKTFADKHYWLTIHGKLDGKFNFKWYSQYASPQIIRIDIIKKKDIDFVFHCSTDFNFSGKLRWGKGAGFSNLRIDLKEAPKVKSTKSVP